jgi:hypothetical protein
VSPAAIVVLTTAGPCAVLTTAASGVSTTAASVVSATAAAVPLGSVMIGVSPLPAAGSAGSTGSCASCYMQRQDTFAYESKYSGCGTR